MKLQAIRRLYKRLLVIMLICWRVNESCTVIQKLSAAFRSNSLLELGGNESDNLNFINFKIDIILKLELSIYAEKNRLV